MMTIENIFVDCSRAGKTIATYEFGWPIGKVRGAPPDRDGLIAEAKSQLTTNGLAFPPYDDVIFEVRYPVWTDFPVGVDLGPDHQDEPGGDSVGNDLGSGGFSSSFGEGFNGATGEAPRCRVALFTGSNRSPIRSPEASMIDILICVMRDLRGMGRT